MPRRRYKGLKQGLLGDCNFTLSDLTTGSTVTWNGTTKRWDLATDTLSLPTQKTPASAAATGTAGDIAHDSNYIYVCTATDTWKRVAIATW